jgi:hypothetical protein
LEDNLRAFDFEIIYRKGIEMHSDFSSHQFVNLIQINNRQMEKDQNQEECIRQLKNWRLNGTEFSHPTAKILIRDYLSKMFFIKDDILWVRIQTKGKPTQVCTVIPQNQIQEILKDSTSPRSTGGLVWTRTLQSFFKIVELVRRPKSAGTPPTCLLLHRFVQKPINECSWT